MFHTKCHKTLGYQRKASLSNERHHGLCVSLIFLRVNVSLVYIPFFKTGAFKSLCTKNMKVFTQRNSLNTFMHHTPCKNVKERQKRVLGFKCAHSFSHTLTRR